MRTPLAVAVLCIGLSACYRYVPAAGLQPAAGDEVRFTLSPDASTRLGPVLGAGTVGLTGRILADEAENFALAVDRTFKQDGVAVVWGGDRVTIPRSAIAGTERRVLDRRRTIMTTGAAVLTAVVTAFIVSRSRADAGESGVGAPPPPPP